jgi:hypothetical protein
VQVEEGLVVATMVEESAAAPPPVVAAVIKEGRTIMEATASQVILEPLAETGAGGEDVVMVPADDGLAPPPPAGGGGGQGAATSMAPKSSTVAGTTSVENAVDLASCRFVDFDAPELPSNDREMLEVAIEQMFMDPSILDTITSVASALRQDEGAGGLAPPAASEAAEGVLEESTVSAELVVIVPPPTSPGESMGASLPQPAEAVMATPTAPVVGTAEGVVGGAGPSSPRPAATAAEEVLVPSLPAVTPQERDAPEGATRAASPKIQEAEESSGAALSQGVGNGKAQVLELACAPWAATFEAGDDVEYEEEVAMCNTLERGLVWVHHAFGEMILPATSVSFLAWVTCFFNFLVLPRSAAYLRLVWGRSSWRQVGGEHARHECRCGM